MDLDEFVETVLKDVLSGIRNVQKDPSIGSFVVPAMIGGHDYADHARVSIQAHLTSTIIDFDIAVTVEESSAVTGEGGIKIAGIGAKVEGDSQAKDTRTSRIQFAVPVLLPESQRSWSDDIKDDA